MDECCKNCKWLESDEDDDICTCDESDNYGCLMFFDDSCECFEEREE